MVWCAETGDWKDSNEPSKWTTSKEKRRASREEEDEDDSDTEAKPQAKRYRGWSAQGIARYNQLFAEIKEAREQIGYDDFETYCNVQFLEEDEANGKRKHKRCKVGTDKPLPIAKHELWDDDINEPAEPEQETTLQFPSGLRDLGIVGSMGAV